MDEDSVDHERAFAETVARILERDGRIEEVSDEFVEEFAESMTAKRATQSIDAEFHGAPKLKPVHNRVSEFQELLEQSRSYD